MTFSKKKKLDVDESLDKDFSIMVEFAPRAFCGYLLDAEGIILQESNISCGQYVLSKLTEVKKNHSVLTFYSSNSKNKPQGIPL